MQKPLKNYAFIDSQNINLGIRELGWKLDFRKFRIYLKEKYAVGVAYLFIGYIPEYQSMYSSLQKYGFILVFKPTHKPKKGNVKGNVDADLVLRAMIEYKNYEKAVLVTSDGDFYSVAEYLYANNKLQSVLSPSSQQCSTLLKDTAKEKMMFMDNLRKRLELKKKEKAPPKDRT